MGTGDLSGQLELVAQVHGAELRVEIRNRTRAPIRVWDRGNPWGWDNLALRVWSSSQPDVCVTLEAEPQTWTRTGPLFVEIPAGVCHVVTLGADNPVWLGADALVSVRHLSLRVQPLLRIRSSPEAAECGVLVGEVAGIEVVSDPPHAWLLPL